MDHFGSELDLLGSELDLLGSELDHFGSKWIIWDPLCLTKSTVFSFLIGRHNDVSTLSCQLHPNTVIPRYPLQLLNKNEDHNCNLIKFSGSQTFLAFGTINFRKIALHT